MAYTFVIPIVAIVMSLGLAMLAIWTEHKKDMALIEKGLYQPEKPGPRGQTTLIWGLILTLVGLAVIVGALVMYRHFLMAGLVVEALGIALLVYTLIVKHQTPTE